MNLEMTFEDVLKEWRDDTDVISVHTSGSTGSPKNITLKKDFVRESALRTNSFFSITSESRLHSCVGPQFIGGKMMAIRSDVAGCRFTWETPSNRPLSEVNKDYKIDLIAVVPSQMLHILDNLPSLPEIGAIIIGGSAIHPTLRDKIIQSGLNAYETYGMTETASHIALRKISVESDWFQPLPGISVSLDDRDCLVIRIATIDESKEEEVITNDIAQINKEGCFKIIGRYDRVIITGGKKVNPEELERKIGSVISGEFFITSLPDEKWGERIVLKIEGKKGDETLLREKLIETLKNYEMPKEIVWVDEFERTNNGKIKLKA